MPASAKRVPYVGESMRLTPPAKPRVHSSCFNALAAKWLATSAAEHAESTDVQGPRRPSRKDDLPDATEVLEPMAAYTERPTGERRMSSSKSTIEMPMKTA